MLLSAEFSNLKRPGVSPSSESGLLHFVYGIPWTSFSVLFLVTAISDPSLTPSFVIFLITTSLSTIFGIALLTRGLKARLQALELEAQGRLTEAIVFDRWKQPGAAFDGYYVAYAYQIPFLHSDGPVFTNAEQNYRAYTRLQIGDKITIRYLRGRKHISKMIITAI